MIFSSSINANLAIFSVTTLIFVQTSPTQCFAPSIHNTMLKPMGSIVNKVESSRMMVATTPDMMGKINGQNKPEQTAWECDEEMNCVEVPACDEENCRTTLDVRIHGDWYDLSGKLPLCKQLFFICEERKQVLNFTFCVTHISTQHP